ncbi:MAG: dihydrofolate reductase family protein [Streptococcaceae bacterium]|jgi:dihydrofolate reductase|nr:dihydrofolate reductase family protein [Streptococcaceae bacterium]
MTSSIKLYIATTLDGYIADKNDELQWLFDVTGDGDNGYGEFLDTIDTVIMGKRTYDWLLENEPDEWGYSGKDCYVFTHQALPDNDHVKFVHPENLPDFVRTLKGNIWNVGGGELIGLFLENQLIDEFQITIAPVLLGDGIPLFPKGNYSEKLELIETKTYGQFVELHYRKIK